MIKKAIAIILMISMVSLTAQVAVGNLQVLKTNTVEAKVELKNYLLTEGYTEEEANNLISNLSEDQIQKVSKEIEEAQKGGMSGVDVNDIFYILIGGVLLIVLLGYGIEYLISENAD